MASTYEPIATTTLGSTATGITFSSIPSTYTDLKLIITYKTPNPNNQGLRFNSDSGTNYSRTYLSGDGSAVSTFTYGNEDWIRLDSGRGSTNPNSTDVAFVVVDIFSYTKSIYKTVLTTINADYNGSGIITPSAQIWRSTSTINTVYFYSNGASNLATGTTATLYGIKAA